MGKPFRPLVRLKNSLREKLWFKPAMFCILAVISVIVCYYIQLLPFTPAIDFISIDTVESLLSVITTAMLTVATFAVGAMVSAYAAATSSATPRAFRLVLADDASQNALSSFLGAFIFGVIGLIAVKSDAFSNSKGVLTLFIATLWIFAWVIGTFVRWVDSIARLGQIQTSINKAEQASRNALNYRYTYPTLGAHCYEDSMERWEVAILSQETGFVMNVAPQKLQKCAKNYDCKIAVTVQVGEFVVKGMPIARIQQVNLDQSLIDTINAAFAIGKDRSFNDDPGFGITVLSEIGSRALSPGINDPGTAISINYTLLTLFLEWFEPQKVASEVTYDRVYIKPISTRNLLESGYLGLFRDGSDNLQVTCAMLRSMLTLKKQLNSEAKALADEFADKLVEYAKQALPLESEVNQIEKRLQEIHDTD